MGQHSFAKGGPELLVGHSFSSESDDGEVGGQQAIEQQIVERRNQATTCQIARSSEDDERAGLDRREGLLRWFDVDTMNRRHGMILPFHSVPAKCISQGG